MSWFFSSSAPTPVGQTVDTKSAPVVAPIVPTAAISVSTAKDREIADAAAARPLLNRLLELADEANASIDAASVADRTKMLAAALALMPVKVVVPPTPAPTVAAPTPAVSITPTITVAATPTAAPLTTPATPSSVAPILMPSTSVTETVLSTANQSSIKFQIGDKVDAMWVLNEWWQATVNNVFTNETPNGSVTSYRVTYEDGYMATVGAGAIRARQATTRSGASVKVIADAESIVKAKQSLLADQLRTIISALLRCTWPTVKAGQHVWRTRWADRTDTTVTDHTVVEIARRGSETVLLLSEQGAISPMDGFKMRVAGDPLLLSEPETIKAIPFFSEVFGDSTIDDFRAASAVMWALGVKTPVVRMPLASPVNEVEAIN
jgi:hypothetical protein